MSIFDEDSERGRLAREACDRYALGDDDAKAYYARIRELKALPADWTPPPPPRRRGTIPAGIRRELLSLPCAYCGDDASVVDHVIPFSRGGSDDRDNLAPACWPCNKEKYDATADEWRDWRLAHGRSWPVDRAADHVQAITYAVKELGY